MSGGLLRDIEIAREEVANKASVLRVTIDRMEGMAIAQSSPSRAMEMMGEMRVEVLDLLSRLALLAKFTEAEIALRSSAARSIAKLAANDHEEGTEA